MPARVVVGAQWGDEGKGKIVHWLAESSDLVVRYQGGDNAGHTVVFGGKSFALHAVPSGMLTRKALSALGNGVVLNPAALRAELMGLERAGIRTRGRLIVSPLCHVLLPYHVALDERREAGRDGIGTTKKGIGPCYEDKAGRTGVRLCDFLDEPLFRELVEMNLDRKARSLGGAKAVCALREETFRDYEDQRRFLEPLTADVSAAISQALRRGRSVIFEGAQGAMLDVDFGTYPFVTVSSPAAGGACTGAGVPPTSIDETIGVAKAYTTRVGAGPFPTEIQDETARRIRDSGREFGTTTGRPRRIGWLDLVQLRAALRISGIRRLALTKLDKLSGIDPIRVCVAYRVGGKRTESFPWSRREMEGAVAVYEDFPGFEADLSGARRRKDLPRRARDLVRFIESSLKVKVPIISIGQSREETIASGWD
jgi:adenylosuccinate synthase